MQKITIDNKDYDLDTFSDEAKAQFISFRFVENEINRLQAQLAAMQTARIAYAKTLFAALPVLGGSDTIKLS